MMQRLICVGAVVGAHGVRGEIKVKTFTADEISIGAYGPLTDETGQRSFALTVLRVAKPTLVIARASGVSTRDEAERLKGLRLYIPRDRLPAPGDDEFYIEDLVGLRAETDGGRPLGQVAAVHNFGAGDILEIRRDGAPALLAPFTLAAVPSVSIAAGLVTIAAAALEEWDAGAPPQDGDETEVQP